VIQVTFRGAVALSVQPIGSTSCWDCSPLITLFQPQSARESRLWSVVPQNGAQTTSNWLWQDQENRPNIFDHLASVSLSLYEQGYNKEEKVFSPTYNRIYLQYPNDRMQALAEEITYGLGNNDDKATAAIQWVLRNFPYEEDIRNYGYEEFWAPPTFALRKGSGDCEDGAFIVHSLLLHSGVSYERVRTYGGLVKAGAGAATGGHAWTAYRRESDDQWVILDTSYYPTLAHVNDRPLMKEATLYVDNFFYFDSHYWVNLEDVDRIHNPGAVYAYKLDGFLRRTDYEIKGYLLDALA